MKFRIALIAATAACLVACEKPSRWVVLYKATVAEGNSIVWLANNNDETGNWAKGHCEELAALYKKKFNDNYMCSTVIFEKFKPDVK